MTRCPFQKILTRQLSCLPYSFYSFEPNFHPFNSFLRSLNLTDTWMFDWKNTSGRDFRRKGSCHEMDPELQCTQTDWYSFEIFVDLQTNNLFHAINSIFQIEKTFSWGGEEGSSGQSIKTRPGYFTKHARLIETVRHNIFVLLPKLPSPVTQISRALSS